MLYISWWAKGSQQFSSFGGKSRRIYLPSLWRLTLCAVGFVIAVKGDIVFILCNRVPHSEIAKIFILCD